VSLGTRTIRTIRIARAETVAEARRAIPVLDWAVSRALPSGVLAEQVHPYTGQPISVSPLTWSHATYVAVVADYLHKLQEFEEASHPNHFLLNGHQKLADWGLVPVIAWDELLSIVPRAYEPATGADLPFVVGLA
jgi:hypothetical protein